MAGKIVRLEGDVETSGGKLTASATFSSLIDDFLHWKPIPPKTAKKLAEVCARLCRLLREAKQADLLNRICEGPLQSVEELRAAGAFSSSDAAPAKPKTKSNT